MKFVVIDANLVSINVCVIVSVIVDVVVIVIVVESRKQILKFKLYRVRNI